MLLPDGTLPNELPACGTEADEGGGWPLAGCAPRRDWRR